MSEKREAELKAKTFAELKRQVPAVRVLQFSTAGAPDRHIVLAGVGSYWEMKHGTPNFESPGLQSLECARIAAQGLPCYYVIWQENTKGEKQRTLIVHPRVIVERKGSNIEQYVAGCDGYDIHWLVKYIRGVHRL